MRRNLGRIYRRLTASAGMVLMTYMAAQGNPADPYIECDGTSGINTGYRMKGGASRVEVDFQLTTEASSQMRVFGNNVVSLEKSLGAMLYLTGEGGGPATGFRLQNIAATAQTNDVFWERTDYSGRYTAVVDFKNGVCDLAAGGLSDQKTFPAAAYAGLVADMPLSLFGMFSNAAATKFSNGTGLWAPRIAKAKVFGVKIYEDYDVAADDNSANLVHDFVPCRRDDGVACLKDLVTGRFATGEDVAAFTASDTAPEYPDDGYVSTVSETPGEYLYMDTGYQVKDTTRVELDCALASNMVGNANWVLFDAYYGGRFRLCYDQTFRYWVGSGAAAETAVDAAGLPKPVAGRDVRRTFILDIPALAASVVTAGFTNGAATVASAAPGYAASGNTLKLACVYGTTWAIASSGFAPLKIYGCRIYEDGELVRDFKPYVKDGKAGLRDLAGGGFTVGKCKVDSAAGTDASLPWGGGSDPYIESDGEAGTGLSTGYRMKGGVSRVEVDFMLVDITPDARIFGNDSTDDDAGEFRDRNMRTVLYLSSTTNYGFYVGKGAAIASSDENNARNVWAPKGPGTTGGECGVRRTAIIDLKEQSQAVVTDGATNFYVHSYNESTGTGVDLRGVESSMPLPLFNRFADDEGETFSRYPARARVYGVRIYEDDVLVHDFTPYMKNGEPGLFDLVGGSFVTGRNADGDNTFVLGGAYMSEGADDAYLETDGTAGFNTGYCMKGGISRVEVDYCLTNTAGSAQMRVFGTTAALEATLKTCFYYTGDGRGGVGDSWKFFNKTGSETTYDYQVIMAADTDRHCLVDDLKNGCWIITGDDDSHHKTSGYPALAGEAATLPLSVFGSFANAAGTSYANGTGQYDSRCTAGRLYGVRIYEDYDTAAADNSANLVHEFIPYSKGGVVGFYDTVTGEVKALEGAKFAFAAPATDYVHAKTYIKASGAVVTKDAPVVLSAYAPGAASYRWTCDGEAVEGGADGTLTVKWKKDAASREYRAVAVYGTAVYGGERANAPSAPAAVAFALDGMLLILK